MLRKILIIFLTAPLLVAAITARTPFPVVLLMLSLILIALFTPSVQDEQQE